MATKKPVCTALRATTPTRMERISMTPAGKGLVRALSHHLLPMCSLIHSFIHSFSRVTFTRHHLCAWPCAGYGDALETTEAYQELSQGCGPDTLKNVSGEGSGFLQGVLGSQSKQQSRGRSWLGQ